MLGIVIVQRSTRSSLCMLLALAAIAACSSGQSGTNDTPAPRTCSKDVIRYHAYLSTGTCADVTGAGGVWLARSAFPDAPNEIRDAACTYAWTPPAGSNAQPDVPALEALKAELLTKGETITVTDKCEAPALGPSSVRALTPSETAAPPTGVSGCDVCGRISIRRVYVILPIDKTKLKTFVVGTQGGKFISYAVDAPANTQVFSVELPAAETSYVQGRINMLEAPF